MSGYHVQAAKKREHKTPATIGQVFVNCDKIPAGSYKDSCREISTYKIDGKCILSARCLTTHAMTDGYKYSNYVLRHIKFTSNDQKFGNRKGNLVTEF